MPRFIGKVLVTYDFEAESKSEAMGILLIDTEFPLFPDGIGGSVHDEVVSLEEVKNER